MTLSARHPHDLGGLRRVVCCSPASRDRSRSSGRGARPAASGRRRMRYATGQLSLHRHLGSPNTEFPSLWTRQRPRGTRKSTCGQSRSSTARAKLGADLRFQSRAQGEHEPEQHSQLAVCPGDTVRPEAQNRGCFSVPFHERHCGTCGARRPLMGRRKAPAATRAKKGARNETGWTSRCGRVALRGLGLTRECRFDCTASRSRIDLPRGGRHLVPERVRRVRGTSCMHAGWHCRLATARVVRQQPTRGREQPLPSSRIRWCRDLWEGGC